MREIAKKRNLRSKTFDLGGRKRMLRLGIKKPLHYVNEQGKLEDIDLTPTLDRGQHFISKAPYKARIARTFPGYRYTGERGTISAELVAINGNAIGKREPGYADKRFYWRGISLDTDCTIIPRNARLDAIVTLHSENAPRSFTWEILGDKVMMRPVVGRDAKGRSLELEQTWSGDRLTIKWTGRVIDKRTARRGQPVAEPKYPVWIDPTVNEEIVAGADDVVSIWDSLGATFYDFLPSSAEFSVGFTYSSFNVVAYAGLRFQSINIPQGVTVDSAILTVDVSAINGTPSTIFYGNDVDDAAAFTNPSNRVKDFTKTSASVAFTPGSTGVQTVSVQSIVQEILTRAGWASGNDLALGCFYYNIPNTTNNHLWSLVAYEHATRQEAQLDITYTEAGGAPFLRPGGIFGLS